MQDRQSACFGGTGWKCPARSAKVNVSTSANKTMPFWSCIPSSATNSTCVESIFNILLENILYHITPSLSIVKLGLTIHGQDTIKLIPDKFAIPPSEVTHLQQLIQPLRQSTITPQLCGKACFNASLARILSLNLK